MKLSDLFAASQRISLVASEEARRLGHPEVDLEHVLLALLLTDGQAGAVLRSHGVTLAATREAVEREHADLVASLGVTPPAVVPEPLREGTGLDWSQRALLLLRAIDDWSSDLPLLTALLDEPSGFVGRVVVRLGVDEASLRQGLADEAPAAPADPLADDDAWVSHTHSGFVPVEPEQVWSLAADPLRRPAWDSAVARVEPHGEGLWRLVSVENPHGRRPVPEERRTSTLRLVEQEPGGHVEWETTARRRDGSEARQRLRVVVLPTTGGTRVVLRLAGRRRRGWKALVQRRLGRLHHYFLNQVLISLAGGLSRALR